MAIRNAERRGDNHLERLRRKRDQAYELAGCARRDGDRVDEARWTKEAKDYEQQIREYLA